MALAFFVSLNTQAGVISVELSEQNLSAGDIVEVSILGTGFSEFDSLSVDLEFDTSLFSFDEFSLGGDLFNADPFGLIVSEQPFGVALTFLSFIPFIGGDFTIATFDLIAITGGETDFSLKNEIAGLFDPILFDSVDVGATAVDSKLVASVSAPATLGLFALAGLGLMSLRRKI